MPVSKEELAKDLETPEYQQLVKETLAKKDYIVQDKTEHSQYLDRYKNDVIEKEMPARVKAIYDNIDKDVKETFGIEREPNEKTYDYMKRAGKATTTALTQSSEKIRQLEEAIAKGDTSAAMAKKLEEEEAKFKRLLKDRDTKIAELEQQTQITGRQADVKLLYGDLKKSFVKQLPPLFDKAEKSTLDEAIRYSTLKDGKLYMTNADGSIRKDASYNEISVEEYLRQEFKDVIEQKKSAGGAGSPPGPGGNGAPDPKAMTPENFQMKPDIKTKAALMDYMISLGLKRGEKNFTLIYQKYGLNLEA